MTLEERVAKLEKQMKRLNTSQLQMQRNQTPQTATLDNTVSGLDAITPYTETKTAYIGDTGIVFDNVPQGNVIVYMTKIVPYTFEYMLDNIVVHFEEPLKEVTDITIAIMK